MILRTRKELKELQDRMNNKEDSMAIYADLNKRLADAGILKKRKFTNRAELSKVLERFPDETF
jgi:hypothetical protein